MAPPKPKTAANAKRLHISPYAERSHGKKALIAVITIPRSTRTAKLVRRNSQILLIKANIGKYLRYKK